MAKTYYLPKSDGGKAQTLEQFRDNIGPYVTLFGLSSSDVMQQGIEAALFRALVNFAATVQDNAGLWVAWKDFMRDGPKVGHPTPTVPVLPAVPSAISGSTAAAGLLARFLLLANAIKNHKNYTAAVGQILGLEGADQTAPDLTTIQPAIDAKVTGGQVAIKWGWQGQSAFLDLLEIQVDRADTKGYVLLTYDTTPGYTDTAPLPAIAAKWKYRAIYRVADARVGVWSDEVNITVGG